MLAESTCVPKLQSAIGMHDILGHRGGIEGADCLRLSDSDVLVASASADGTARLWHTREVPSIAGSSEA